MSEQTYLTQDASISVTTFYGGEVRGRMFTFRATRVLGIPVERTVSEAQLSAWIEGPYLSPDESELTSPVDLTILSDNSLRTMHRTFLDQSRRGVSHTIEDLQRRMDLLREADRRSITLGGAALDRESQ